MAGGAPLPPAHAPRSLSVVERATGAEIVEPGRAFDEARVEAEAYTNDHRMRYVHPANEPLLIAGTGTIAMELAEDVPDADVVSTESMSPPDR